jgi:hypothetical protein
MIIVGVKARGALYVECREKAEREASPTACIIDSQSVKSAEKGGPSMDPHGFDAGKLIKGKKRHILVDMQGLLLHAIVHSAGVQDRDGGIWLLATLFGQFPFLAKLFADSAYAGSSSILRSWSNLHGFHRAGDGGALQTRI